LPRKAQKAPKVKSRGNARCRKMRASSPTFGEGPSTAKSCWAPITSGGGKKDQKVEEGPHERKKIRMGYLPEISSSLSKRINGEGKQRSSEKGGKKRKQKYGISRGSQKEVKLKERGLQPLPLSIHEKRCWGAKKGYL